MATIDWSKPLRRITTGVPATTYVLPTGERIVRWKAPSCRASVACVNEDGRLYIGITVFAQDRDWYYPKGTALFENATVTKWQVAGSKGSTAIQSMVFDRKDDATATAYGHLIKGADSVSVRPVEV